MSTVFTVQNEYLQLTPWLIQCFKIVPKAKRCQVLLSDFTSVISKMGPIVASLLTCSKNRFENAMEVRFEETRGVGPL